LDTLKKIELEKLEAILPRSIINPKITLPENENKHSNKARKVIINIIIINT